MRSHVTVVVPATSANLGPGFDVLGVALRLYNRIEVEVGGPAGQAAVTVTGEGAEVLESGAGNLLYRSACRLFNAVGVAPPGLRMHCVNAIPVSRGLGSSSSAIVGGLVAANALLDAPLGPDELLALAVEIEGHPDNVAPALLGGFQVCTKGPDGIARLGIPPPPGLRAVVCIPDRPISTQAARQVLPERYSRADAVANTGHCALLCTALALNRPDLLPAAMADRFHEPYRGPLIPGYENAMQAARATGALGACISGSGSTLLAFTRDDGAAIGAAMCDAVRGAGADARWLALEIDAAGARVESVNSKAPSGNK